MIARMNKRTRRRLRKLEEILDVLEANDHTLSIRVGHLFSYRHEHWAKIRELDHRVSALEGRPPPDWNYSSRAIRVGSGPKPSKRRMRKARERVSEAVKAVRENRLRHADPADVAKADAVFDELTGEITPDE